MITEQHLASFKRADRDLYAREKVLNSAIIAADISSGWEGYLEIFDAFYADDVEVGDGAESGAVFGRERIRALLYNFLVPIHVMAEIGGLSVQIRRSTAGLFESGDTSNRCHGKLYRQRLSIGRLSIFSSKNEPELRSGRPVLGSFRF